MSTTTRITTAERFGRWLGRGWLGYVHVERRVAAWMVGKGVPEAVAVALVWVVKLAVLGVLLYLAFWIAVFMVSIVVWIWVASQNLEKDELDFEFQFPTTLGELRETIGYDPNMYNDISHEMFRDD